MIYINFADAWPNSDLIDEVVREMYPVNHYFKRLNIQDKKLCEVRQDAMQILKERHLEALFFKTCSTIQYGTLSEKLLHPMPAWTDAVLVSFVWDEISQENREILLQEYTHMSAFKNRRLAEGKFRQTSND